jgi:uncharacterized protein with HEPN domain
MSRRDDQSLLRDMLLTAREAQADVKDARPEELFAQHVRLLGLVKCLEIIGEAASQLSPALRERHPEIPWNQIIGMRNRLVHAYFDVDDQQIWKSLSEDLPVLIEQLDKILAENA